MQVQVALLDAGRVLITKIAGEDLPGCPLGVQPVSENPGEYQGYACMTNVCVSLSATVMQRLETFGRFTAEVSPPASPQGPFQLYNLLYS